MEFVVTVNLVTRYAFTDDKSQREVKGTKIHYFRDEVIDTEDKKGLETLTISADYDVFNHFTVVPGKYRIKCDMVPGPKNSVKLQYSSSEMVK